MADPFSIALAAGGAGISAFGAFSGGQAQSRQLQYQAAVAELNKKIALQNADYAQHTGDIQGRQYGMQAAQRAGAIRAGIGASGIDIGSGSKAAVQDSQRYVTELDTAQIRDNAARKAYGYAVEATQNEAQAGLLRSAASDAESAGMIKAVGSLVSGAGSVADKWYQGSSVGLFGGGSGSSSGNYGGTGGNLGGFY